jgi:predicted transcriptional regulator of viral defense system
MRLRILIFGLQDIYAHLDGETGISCQTISWHLTKLTETGRLHRIGHGRYAVKTKQQITVILTDEECTLNEELKQH